jgi:hypothetical protein
VADDLANGMYENIGNLLVHPIGGDQIRGAAEPLGHEGHES